MSDPRPSGDTRLENDGRFFPNLRASEWITFAILAGALAAANIYTTLLIGWGDTGSIIAVLGSVLVLGILGRGRKPSVHSINLGQTMASAGGSIGFAMASYAAVYLIDPDFDPDPVTLTALFAAMGFVGAIVGSSVRKTMVRYFFPSGTACAVIQRTVTKEVAPGERNKPVYMLKLWGSIAAVWATLKLVVWTSPQRIAEIVTAGGAAPKPVISDVTHELEPFQGVARSVGIGGDPLYYGIGLVVGPRIGLGMLIGALGVPFLLLPMLETAVVPDGENFARMFGDWKVWMSIAVLTLPTLAAIVFAYLFRTPAVVPPGFTPGATNYTSPKAYKGLMGVLLLVGATLVSIGAQAVFGMPWPVTLLVIAVAWPLCIVNGRVSGDTDINPVRLVAIVFLAGFATLVDSNVTALLGMAVVGGTLAAVAVDMMQDYRTGHLVDANPVHQTSVQLVGSIVGALVAVPVLLMLYAKLGLGPDSTLKAPGAQVWAGVARTMAEGMPAYEGIWTAVIALSIVGCGYAYLTVWPKTASLMPSLFGIGIGMLVGVEASAAIFGGGLIKVIVTWFYTRGKRDAELAEATEEAGNDTMLAGASVFAAGAVVSILWVVLSEAFKLFDAEWFSIG
ncbi:MAG: hypothetical protein DHS20C15_12120 [Planctomycetota bacterium]|nr:MAG: hypothetical protein DHS20C15_12120 [Planctomycetota bacterium]